MNAQGLGGDPKGPTLTHQREQASLSRKEKEARKRLGLGQRKNTQSGEITEVLSKGATQARDDQRAREYLQRSQVRVTFGTTEVRRELRDFKREQEAREEAGKKIQGLSAEKAAEIGAIEREIRLAIRDMLEKEQKLKSRERKLWEQQLDKLQKLGKARRNSKRRLARRRRRLQRQRRVSELRRCWFLLAENRPDSTAHTRE